MSNTIQTQYGFKDDQTEERNIHIGLDLWIDAGTPVFSALDGRVHSFQNNDSLGNYGPTIILEHQVEDLTFILYMVICR
jgi:murein DD-endopeptidase MepM/ murein hydrolase activator NlpD